MKKQAVCFEFERGLFLPVLADGRTLLCRGSDWTGEEADKTGMEVEESGGAALFPMKDLTLSRHCSASLNIRSPSTATISLSSMENKIMENVLRRGTSEHK